MHDHKHAPEEEPRSYDPAPVPVMSHSSLVIPHPTGFQDIRGSPKDESREFIKDWAPGRGVEDDVLSAHIEANKPAAQHT
jgi:hypothetical protein